MSQKSEKYARAMECRVSRLEETVESMAFDVTAQGVRLDIAAGTVEEIVRSAERDARKERREVRRRQRVRRRVAGLVLAVLAVTLLAVAVTMTGASSEPRSAQAALTAAHDMADAVIELWGGKADKPELISLGTFTCYAYCSCPGCCGQWSGGPTQSGIMPKEGRTVAADWSVLPAGTEIYIDGVGWRTVEDTGSGITGDKLDIYMESHQAALEWGVKELEVYQCENLSN